MLALRRAHSSYGLTRLFSHLSVHAQKPLPPLPVLHEGDYTETFLRGTGPGGQKINKTSCAVQLQHHATGIVVKCQESRSRTVNRAIARKWLQLKIEEQQLGSESRTMVKQRAESERKRSRAKKSRRKYRALETEKASAEESAVERETAGAAMGAEGARDTAEARETQAGEDAHAQAGQTQDARRK